MASHWDVQVIMAHCYRDNPNVLCYIRDASITMGHHYGLDNSTLHGM